MLPHSSTREPLAHFNHDASLSPSSSDDKCSAPSQPLPFPVMSRSSTRASTATYNSSMPLNPGSHHKNQRKSLAHRVFAGWQHHGQGIPDREAQHLGYSPYGEKGGSRKAPQVKVWHGWRLIIFDSCMRFFPKYPSCASTKQSVGLNILILLVPAAVSASRRVLGTSRCVLTNGLLQGVLRVTVDSDTLIFVGGYFSPL